MNQGSLFYRFFYSGAILIAIAAFLNFLLLLDQFLKDSFPSFPRWTIPVALAVVLWAVGRVIMARLGETDRLKYEFITIATHKLRTPLTHIHWLIPDLLSKAGQNPEIHDGLRRVDDANNRLIELTNVLIEAANSDASFAYQKTAVDLRHLAWEAVKHFHAQISEKQLSVSVEAEQAPYALGDMRRIGSVVEVLIENAVIYTPAGGKIQIFISPDKRGVRFEVKDSGIGIKPEDRHRIFSKFFRTEMAKTSDTEGVGLGLALSKDVIEKLGGQIGADSEGMNKGSTFWFTLEATKELYGVPQ